MAGLGPLLARRKSREAKVKLASCQLHSGPRAHYRGLWSLVSMPAHRQTPGPPLLLAGSCSFQDGENSESIAVFRPGGCSLNCRLLLYSLPHPPPPRQSGAVPIRYRRQIAAAQQCLPCLHRLQQPSLGPAGPLPSTANQH